MIHDTMCPKAGLLDKTDALTTCLCDLIREVRMQERNAIVDNGREGQRYQGGNL